MSAIYSIIDLLLPFEWTEFAYMKNALLAILLITPLFGLVGVMIVNNKMSFFSDALGHSALTGIAIGVLMGIDNYLISMMGFSLLFALCISAVMNSETSSSDTIIGVFSSTGLALGIVLLSASGGFAKYSGYLIGDILTVQPEEIRMLALILVAVVLLWGFFFNKLMLVSMNTDLAASKGIRIRMVEKFFVILVAVIVTVSIKWVGVLIINSLLVLPAAAARNLAKSMRSYHFIAIGISVFSGVSGLIISYYAGTAAGGTIVLVAAVIFFLTYFLNQVRAKA
ncbi:metal ABC transporter permease [Caproiciproducens galactitolivorans]|uniref:Metal ABC transporter permease n=1 Tax=Caproiciproducens galactitolivorans TaxID=642589 RepID=A0ABT4BU08_9FIRM|nr:metal ABC transporter permease [Caproiciproducens galactitolivorans]MCY1714394.1 metal ABC transporter permease [Caproiciproducens galactitolivorans]